MLSKIQKYGVHERDRPLEQAGVMKLRRAMTENTDWKVDGANLYIGDELIACATPKRAELIVLMRDGLLQLLNDNVVLRLQLADLQGSYSRLADSFRALWKRTQNGK